MRILLLNVIRFKANDSLLSEGSAELFVVLKLVLNLYSYKADKELLNTKCIKTR